MIKNTRICSNLLSELFQDEVPHLFAVERPISRPISCQCGARYFFSRMSSCTLPSKCHSTKNNNSYLIIKNNYLSTLLNCFQQRKLNSLTRRRVRCIALGCAALLASICNIAYPTAKSRRWPRVPTLGTGAFRPWS